MPLKSSLVVIAVMGVLAGCATPSQPVKGGKHLVYRDAGGKPTLQIDYPSEDFCRKVEAIASRNARCEVESAGGQLPARATLRYNPPGLLVQGHYANLAECEKANSAMSQGVELAQPCASK